MEDFGRVKFVRYSLEVFFLIVITVVACLVSLSVGSVDISISEIISVFVGTNDNSTLDQIIFNIRLPRILLGVAVGGGLSITGAIFQSILMNPLAEPYILGISSGGTFGAVLSFFLGMSFLGTQALAFAGALSVVFLVFMLGRRYGEIEPNILLLSGVMIGAFFSAAILLLMTLLDNSLRNVVFWLVGNLSIADANAAEYLLPLSLLLLIVLSVNSHKFNILAMGEESARHLGINTNRVKNGAYIISSLMIGAIVSVTGIIGFVGLLIPHLCRLVFGIDNRIVIPSSFFAGAAFLVLADTLARTVIAPAELPVGSVTALFGAPIFVYLLRRRSENIA